jgi:hypothetical protein
MKINWRSVASLVKGCLDVPSTHDPSTCSLFFQSWRSYRPAEGRVEAKRRQRPGPPPATTNRLLAEPGGGPWVNCAWVEVSRGRFVGGRIIKAPCKSIENGTTIFSVQVTSCVEAPAPFVSFTVSKSTILFHNGDS